MDHYFLDTQLFFTSRRSSEGSSRNVAGHPVLKGRLAIFRNLSLAGEISTEANAAGYLISKLLLTFVLLIPQVEKVLEIKAVSLELVGQLKFSTLFRSKCVSFGTEPALIWAEVSKPERMQNGFNHD